MAPEIPPWGESPNATIYARAVQSGLANGRNEQTCGVVGLGSGRIGENTRARFEGFREALKP